MIWVMHLLCLCFVRCCYCEYDGGPATAIKPKKIQIVYIKVPLALKSTKSSVVNQASVNNNNNNNNNNGHYSNSNGDYIGVASVAIKTGNNRYNSQVNGFTGRGGHHHSNNDGFDVDNSIGSSFKYNNDNNNFRASFVAAKGNHFRDTENTLSDSNLGDAYNAATRDALPYQESTKNAQNFIYKPNNEAIRNIAPGYEASIVGVSTVLNALNTLNGGKNVMPAAAENAFGKPIPMTSVAAQNGIKNVAIENGFNTFPSHIYGTDLDSNYRQSKKKNKKSFDSFNAFTGNEFGSFAASGHMQPPPPLDAFDSPMAFDMSGMSLAPMKGFGGMSFGKAMVMPSFGSGFGGIRNKLTSLLSTKLGSFGGGGVMTSILGMMGW